jgi:hypothetical protein
VTGARAAVRVAVGVRGGMHDLAVWVGGSSSIIPPLEPPIRASRTSISREASPAQEIARTFPLCLFPGHAIARVKIETLLPPVTVRVGSRFVLPGLERF